MHGRQADSLTPREPRQLWTCPGAEAVGTPEKKAVPSVPLPWVKAPSSLATSPPTSGPPAPLQAKPGVPQMIREAKEE